MRSWCVLNGTFPVDETMAIAYTKDLYERSRHKVGVAWNHIKAQEGFHNLAGQLATITVPSLFIHGELDPLIPLEAGRETAHAVPHAQFKALIGMGHMMFNRELEKKIAHLLIQHFEASFKLSLV